MSSATPCVLCFEIIRRPKEHPHAIAAALAAESVGARGGEDAFWSMHDLLYENQDALQDDDLIEFAAASGVDPIAVADDLSTRATASRVQRDLRSGRRSGARHPPTFFMNGRRFDGDWSDPVALADALQDGTRGHTHTLTTDQVLLGSTRFSWVLLGSF